MKKIQLIGLLICGAMLGGCSQTVGGVWEETKIATRYLGRKGMSLFQNDVDARLVANSDEFYGPEEEEFIPLRDQDLKSQYVDYTAPQAKITPGDPSGPVPGIKQFKSPGNALIAIYRSVYFNTDDHVLRVKEYYHTLNRVAEHLKRHPQVYIFVTGNCDERASEAYNLALGTRRANFVRGYLVKQGVNPDQIYTISYGKERPADKGHNRAAWAKNRRCEFKIFDRRSHY
ncbi:MAG: OmpA family protein [Simkaniaceae bacterium]|nr:OmpA family protein [Simkaniaceae bacterium]